ncbi:hypothetical protein AVEN_187167-1 [Araneus ventricosus]|uniref:Uncharacterized protein n=1 Tax=Araneus ventricosus TaxID=182803 RepID=A0A4Y2S0F6_ARAVE|nr:hypothetical protein AVEN_187167-1 [Araneus ventricosus]
MVAIHPAYSVHTKVPYHPFNYRMAAAIFIRVVSRYDKVTMRCWMKPPTAPPAVKTEAIWTSSEIPLPKTRSHRNLKDSYLYPIAEVPFQRGMDRLPAVSDTKASSKCIGTRLAKFRFKGEWIGYWVYQIQKYQVNVSGTNAYQYPPVSDTAKTCINPSLQCTSGPLLELHIAHGVA